jgi:hypothetical protein
MKELIRVEDVDVSLRLQTNSGKIKLKKDQGELFVNHAACENVY